MHPFVKALLPTLTCCVVVAFFTLPVHGGFMLYLVAPFLAIWLLVCIWGAWRQPMRRPVTAVKIILWLVTIGCVVAAHVGYARSARNEAEEVVARVLEYRQRTGAYPASAEAAGLPTRGRWQVYYFLHNGAPRVFYPATFIVFDTYSYDFADQAWEYRPD